MTAKEIHDAEYSAWAEVDLKAIRDNVTAIRRLAAKNKFALPTRYKGKKAMADPARLLAVIKADAYGHGMKEIAQLLFDMDVEFFAVSDVTEGAYLRQMGITTPVLLFESALLENIEQIVDLDFTPTVLTIDFARELNAYAKKFKKRINIHVNIDTGMGRLGVWHEEAEDFIKTLFTFSQITVQGIYTHFPAADNDEQFTKQQLECFYQLVVNLDRQGLVIPYVHAANSMGLAGYKTDFLNIVRPGLMLYGLYPDERFKKRLKLKPALSVKSRIVYIKDIKKGRSISYGRSFIAKKDMTVATVSIGYYDGYPRVLSNKSHVLIKGVRCPILGVVTMDQVVVDVTNVPSLKVGSQVTVLGEDKNVTVSADELAKLSDTIHYEIVCSLGNHLPRVFKKA